MKKIVLMAMGISSVLLLSACGNSSSSKSGNNSVHAVSQMKVKKASSESSSSTAQQKEQPAKQTPQTSASKLDVDKLSSGDLSGLVGTWKSDAGDTMVITSEIQKKPEGSNIAATQGAVISNTEQNGYPQVITVGNDSGGYILGGIGSFDPSILVSAFEPAFIIPKGVTAGADDDSDASRDRIIKGGGQNGYAASAYYRQ